ncbi:hypothetical protein [Candidatus Xianfuyuplasma coldseepsis]|uniref:Uncharacterized protein n=1 Tax=Candidatus Xianfuyuplasma coldseepsis TaxID=2782163 RepID=A0A7L7KP96_9MOLU|nr:hypothetical protein [Xianfuyuplasma coldseepsis]QMS84610.1 hypothetical protein G4Z02_02205 [Xianfuyuplasma coldseepsis]
MAFIGGPNNSQHNTVGRFFIQAELDRESGGPLSKPQINVPIIGWLLELIFPSKKSPRNVYNGWELKRKQNQYVFTFYIIVYLFFNDDDVITAVEQERIRKLIKKTNGILTEEHYNQIREFSVKTIRLDDVLTFIKEHGYPTEFVLDTLKQVRVLLNNDPVYESLLKQLEQTVI